MDIKQIRMFGEVASSVSISEAARRSFMTQQTLSRKIAALEEETGCKLLNRTVPLTLTPAGKMFLHMSGSVVSSYEAMMRAVKEIAAQPEKEVRVRDYGTGSFRNIFAGTIEIISSEHPNISLRFIRVNEEDTNLIRAHAIDIGFVRCISVDGAYELEICDGLEYIPLNSDKSGLVFGVREGHPLLSLEHPTLEDIAAYGLAMPTDTDKGSLPLAVKSLMSSRNLHPRIDMVYCGSASEGFFEFFTSANPDDVMFFTEWSFAGYIPNLKLGGRRFMKVELAGPRLEVLSFAVVAREGRTPEVDAVIEAMRCVDLNLCDDETFPALRDTPAPDSRPPTDGFVNNRARMRYEAHNCRS